MLPRTDTEDQTHPLFPETLCDKNKSCSDDLPGSSHSAAHAWEHPLEKHLFDSSQWEEVQEPTLHPHPPPPPCLQPFVVFWADHGESGFTDPVSWTGTLCIFMFHPNQSRGREWDSLPAEFPVPNAPWVLWKLSFAFPNFQVLNRVDPCWVHLCLPHQLFHLPFAALHFLCPTDLCFTCAPAEKQLETELLDSDYRYCCLITA